MHAHFARTRIHTHGQFMTHCCPTGLVQPLAEFRPASLECYPDGMQIVIPRMRLYLTGRWAAADGPLCLNNETNEHCCLKSHIDAERDVSNNDYDVVGSSDLRASFKFYECGTTFEVEENRFFRFQNRLRLGSRLVVTSVDSGCKF